MGQANPFVANAYITEKKLLFFIVNEGLTNFRMNITTIYNKNCYLYSKNYKIMVI